MVQGARPPSVGCSCERSPAVPLRAGSGLGDGPGERRWIRLVYVLSAQRRSACAARIWPAEGMPNMAQQPALGFGGLLRQLRAEARLTQEELAEAAGLSPRSVSDLERGINRTARKDTAELLAGALGLAGPVRDLFVAAARGRAPAAEVLAAMQREAAEDLALDQAWCGPGCPYLGLMPFRGAGRAGFLRARRAGGPAGAAACGAAGRAGDTAGGRGVGSRASRRC